MIFRPLFSLVLYIGLALLPLGAFAREIPENPAPETALSSPSEPSISLLESEDDPMTWRVESLRETQYLSLTARWNDTPLTNQGTYALDLAEPSTLSWSYDAHAPEGFELPYSPGVSFETAFQAATLTFQVYKGTIGSSTLAYETQIEHGTAPDIDLPALEDGQYIIVLSAHYPSGTQIPGYVCGGIRPEDYCPTYRTRLDSFQWFMKHGAAYYNDVIDPSDSQYRYRDASYEMQFRFNEYVPLAFGLLEVEVGTPEVSAGVSNVLFLPGIKGSRLYAGDGSKLWEPFGNHDVEALMLDQNGDSIRNDIHVRTGDIIDAIAGISDIYGSYMSFMDELAEDEIINDWRAVPYDWRLSLKDIVGGGVETDGRISYIGTSESPYIRSTLEELASTSKSGKVTIVAHSNGGLVAKELMRTLGDAETARLIDNVIFVGVPQSGAPQALNALFFGYNEGLPSIFPGIVSTHVAREFALNSPMGYHLLPSQGYFDSVTDPNHPVVKFESGRAYDIERSAYGDSIDSYEELKRFAIAAEGGREAPLSIRIDQASILNASLLEYGEQMHETLDAWMPPDGVKVHQIAGWGANTVAGMRYYEKCAFFICASLQEPIFVEDGDGVVPTPSAIMMSEEENTKRYWIDLQAYVFGPLTRKDHGNLLSTDELKLFIKNILTQENSSLPENIYDEEPVNQRQGRQLLFFLHSPLNLEIEDADGNRVGPNEDGTVDEEIPGAEYGVFGGVQYIIAPAGEEYDLALEGYDSGTFTLEIRETEGGETTGEITFLKIPTTALTRASMHVSSNLESEHMLEVDIDGDSVIDTQLIANAGEIAVYGVPNQNESNNVSSKRNQLKIPIQNQENSLEHLQLQLYRLLLQLLLEYLEAQQSAQN